MSWRDHVLDIRPLRASRPFRALLLGSAVSGLGLQIATVAVLAQVWELTGSPLWTGAIGLATAVPILVLGPVGGSLADVVDRRAIALWTAAAQTAAAVALTVQSVLGNDSAALLLVLVAAQSAAAALGAPARRTLPVRLLGPGLVAAGLALQGLAFQAAMLVGPAVGGLLVAWSLPAAYGAQTVATPAATLAVLRLPAVPPLPSSSSADAAPRRRRPERGGWLVILRTRTLRGAFATDLAATVLAMPIALFPLVNEIRFGGDPRTLGLFLSAVAVGGVLAGAMSGTVTRLRRSGLVMLVAAFVWGIALAGFGLAGPLWLALACLAVAGAADTISVVSRGALVQLETPDAYRGRVSAVEHVVGVAGPEVGNARGGVLGALLGAPAALVVGGLSAALVVAVVAVVERPLREYRTPAPALPDAVPV